MTDIQKLMGGARRDVLSGSYASALSVLDDLLRVRPDDVDALLLKGNALEVQAYANSNAEGMSFKNNGPLLEAKECYEKVLVRSPGCIEALRDLANLHKEAGHFEKAMDLLHRALSESDGSKSEDSEGLLGAKEEIEELKRLMG